MNPVHIFTIIIIVLLSQLSIVFEEATIFSLNENLNRIRNRQFGLPALINADIFKKVTYDFCLKMVSILLKRI